MRKSEIVSAVAAAAGLSQRQADDAVAAMLEQITNALSRGDDVALTGFGAFHVRRRAARAGRHPQTGAAIPIPASNHVSFRPGKLLKQRVSDSLR